MINKGGLSDISGQTIYWYLNNRLIEGGRGIQNIKFIAPDLAPDLISLRAQIPNYPGGFLIKEIEIPVVRPEVVIESPYPDNKFRDPSIGLKALPYFFNIKDPSVLNYLWRVNGKAAEGALVPSELAAKINPDARAGSTININVTIENSANEEAAAKSISLIYNP